LARLGPGAFETISGEVVKAVLVILSRGIPCGGKAADGLSGHKIRCVDVSDLRAVAEKAEALAGSAIAAAGQARQLGNQDARVSAEEIRYRRIASEVGILLRRPGVRRSRADEVLFLGIGESRREVDTFPGHNRHLALFGGMTNLLRWEGGSVAIDEIAGSRKDGLNAWGKAGIIASQMGGLPVSLYAGEAFDNNTAIIVPYDKADLPALWCYCSSPEYRTNVRALDRKLNVTSSTLTKVPFGIGRWTAVARERFPHGLPAPYSDDPAQWIYHGHPCRSVVWDGAGKRTAFGPPRKDASVLQVAVARLLGYRWPAELDPGMELAAEQRETASRCAELARFADEDGIVAIPAVRGELSAPGRLRDILAASYGESWSTDVESALLRDAGFAGKSLETWLRDGFFTQHCAMFHHRPFIWQIWDGIRDGFSALVLYHKLTYKRMETLCYTYLGDWIARQKHDLNNGKEGAQERITAAEALLKRLEAVIEGEAPYDIYCRWKPLDRQPIGWAPDINDGVRLNIRPFMMPPDIGRKGAGLLRDKPNIKWDKDRGKDAESAPWFHLYKGDRINDRHLTLAEKRKDRP
jgi:hypothetical protein